MQASPKYLVIDINEPLKELFKALESDKRPAARWLNDWLGDELSLDEAVRCLTIEDDVKLEIKLHAHSIELEYGKALAKATEAFCLALFKKLKALDLYQEGKLITTPFKWYGPFLILELKCTQSPQSSSSTPRRKYGSLSAYVKTHRSLVMQSMQS